MTIYKESRTTFLFGALREQWFPDKELFKSAPLHCTMSMRYDSLGTHALIRSSLVVFLCLLWTFMKESCTEQEEDKNIFIPFAYRELRHNEFSASPILRQMQSNFYFILFIHSNHGFCWFQLQLWPCKSFAKSEPTVPKPVLQEKDQHS